MSDTGPDFEDQEGEGYPEEVESNLDDESSVEITESKEEILRRKRIRELLERRLERKRLREELDDFVDFDGETDEGEEGIFDEER